VKIENRTRAQTHFTVSTGAPYFPAAKVQYDVHRVGPRPIPVLRSTSSHQSGDIVLCVWSMVRFAIFTIQILKSSHLGTQIAITFTILVLEADFYHRLCRIARARVFLYHF
jgi:hypothetical protein